MRAPRQRTPRQRLLLWATSLASLAFGLGVFWAVEGRPAQHAELSFFLEEQLPEQTGLSFEHEKGEFAPFFDNVMPFMQAVSASGCVSDVDHDGLLDLYLTTSGTGAKNRLFRNRGGFKFEPLSIPAVEDVNHEGFSSDCVFADLDNDGWEDLHVGMVGGQPRILMNRPLDDGGRTFVDVTAEAGGATYMNGFAASFFDPDRDGDLDLLLAHYFPTNYFAEDIAGQPRMHPRRVPDHDNAGRMMPNDWGNATNGGRKQLFLNDGTGHFTEADAAAWGLSETRYTFDIGTADINGDGWTDVYFANDFGPDQLYLNRDGKKLEELKGPYPTSVGRDSFKGMNADLADIDHDGFPEIYVTNVFHPVLPEGNLLWKNEPHPSGDAFLRSFVNVAADEGVKNGGWGWGAKFVDVDLDGDVDLMATNGYISQNPDRDYWYRLSRLVAGDKRFIVDSARWPAFEDMSMSGHQVSHVFVNDGERFYNRAEDAGVTRSFDGRGVVIADFDVDGRPDVLWVPQGAPYLLGRNVFRATDDVPAPPHWAGVRVTGDGVKSPRTAVGTRVKVTPSHADDVDAFLPRWFEVSAGNGMTSQSMGWMVAGLGAYGREVDVEVRWTDGHVELHRGLAADRYHDLVRGGRLARAERP
jgi:hypothetical protein